MPLKQPSMNSPGVVVVYMPDRHDHASEHERISIVEFGRRLAALKGYDFGGAYEPSTRYPGRVYFVPNITLTCEQAAALGIRGPDDLFGGVVPHAFVATKAISHPLVDPDAAALPGWNPSFAARVGDAVLAGYTAFSLDDARRAGLRLLENGPARIKPVRATGGHGQTVARDEAELQRLLDGIDPGEVTAHGLVVEENLGEVRTYSVGQVSVADLSASYFGFQRLARNNRGEDVFGGSELNIVRGDLDALPAAGAGAEVACAVELARRYDAAARACFAGFFASRNNYDVVFGRDAQGRPRSGVLEQSWRLGGATGCELAALEMFRKRSTRKRVRAVGVEVYGDSPEPPPHAIVHYRGTDPRVGRLTKYTMIEPYAHSR